MKLRERFRGFLPVVVDIETTGVNPLKHGLLEIAMVTLAMNDKGELILDKTYHEHITPHPGAEVDPEALKINKIDPEHPFRYALDESQALANLFEPIQKAVKTHRCQRAVLVAHNAWFDLLFMNAAIEREKLKSPFHRFTSLDTASIAAVMYGQTVLAKACKVAKIGFDQSKAHSAIYDARQTAELFCKMSNACDIPKKR